HALLTAFERKTDVRAVKPYGGDAMTWHDARDDIHPSPTLVGGGGFQRRVDASSWYHLGVAAAEISVGLLHQPNAFSHRKQPERLFVSQYQRSFRHATPFARQCVQRNCGK